MFASALHHFKDFVDHYSFPAYSFHPSVYAPEGLSSFQSPIISLSRGLFLAIEMTPNH